MAYPFFSNVHGSVRHLDPAAGVTTCRQRRIVRHPIRGGGTGGTARGGHALRCPGDVGNVGMYHRKTIGKP